MRNSHLTLSKKVKKPFYQNINLMVECSTSISTVLLFPLGHLQSRVTKSTDCMQITAVSHSTVQQEAPVTLNEEMNLIAVSREQTLRQHMGQNRNHQQRDTR